MYKIQGNVNSGGNTILDGYQLNLLFTQLQFGQAMISDTANSHTGIDTDNYQFPKPDDAQYRAAASVIYESNDPALITDATTGRKTLVINNNLRRSLSGIVYVDGDIKIESPTWLINDVTFFARNGNITITSVTASNHKIGLVASSQVNDPNDPDYNSTGNINLGTMALFGNNNNPVFIHAERNIYATKNGGLDDLINYSGLNGTLIGRNISLNNIKINYNQAIKTPYTANCASAPPLPPNMGTAVKITQLNWNDFGVTSGPGL